MTRRPHLIIARVGRNSLHRQWFSGQSGRNWDLWLCPYQTLAPQDDIDCVVGDAVPGPKWTGLRQMLKDKPEWRDYERIWLPDDDIDASQETINAMFDIGGALGLELCQPALHPSSYYAHYTTMQNQRCVARRTGFVEIMVPCFSRDALQRLEHTLDLTRTGWGWGLDSLWPKLLDHRNVGIIDGTPVLHTRPVGAFRDDDLSRAVHAESDNIMALHACRQVHTTFEAIGRDLKALNLSPAALATLLVDGWRYLLDIEPSLLPWMVEAQRPAQGWGGYPVAGVPSQGMALRPTAAKRPALKPAALKQAA